MTHEYTYNTVWSEDDKEFVGLCNEFSGLSWLDKTEQDALNGIKALVESIEKDLKNDKRV